MVDTLTNDEIASLTLEKAEEVLQKHQKSIKSIFDEAKTADGKSDFNQVKSLTGVKGSIAVAEYLNQINDELNAVGEARDKLIKAAQAEASLDEMTKGRRSFPLPGGASANGRGNYPDESERFKSLGQMVGESKAFTDWHKGGAAGGASISMDDALPSDFLAKAAAFETIGTKAVMSTSAGYAPEVLRAPGFVDMLTRPIQMLDIIPMGRTSQAAYAYMEETTRTHAAAETAEGAAYPESAFSFTPKTTPVVKIADSVPVTDEQLEDVAMIESYINGRLTFGIRQRFDRQTLIGSGTGSNLRGLKNVVGLQTQALGADPVPSAFYKAMTKVRLGGRSMPTHHVIHPEDWQDIRLERTTDGVYIWGSPSEAGPERMWGLGVVQQDADAAGTGYTGAFTPDCVSAFERRGVDIQVGFVGTQFLAGLRTIRGDMRLALAWFRPAAFCQVTGI